MPGLEKIRKDAHYCAACDRWNPQVRKLSQSREYIIFEVFQKGKCRGGVPNGLPVPPMGKCKRWTMWKTARRTVNFSPHLLATIDEEVSVDLEQKLAEQRAADRSS